MMRIKGHSPSEFTKGALRCMEEFIEQEKRNIAKGYHLKSFVFVASYIEPHDDEIANAMSGSPTNIMDLCNRANDVIVERLFAADRATFKREN